MCKEATSVVKHAIGPAVHKDMVASVKASPAFSVSFRSKTGFLSLYDIPQANTANLFECLDLQISKDDMGYEKLVGWNSDAASVMLGSRNSVVSRFLCVLHCICHVFHLIVGDSVKCIPSYVIDLVEKLFWWFHHSSKRVNELRSFQEW